MKKSLRPQLRQLSIFLCALFFVIVSVRSLYEASLQNPGFLASLVLGTLSLGLAYFVFKQYSWALRLVAAIFIGLAVFLPVGLLGPFTAGDYLASGKEPPSLSETLSWLVPLEFLLLGLVFLIDPNDKNGDERLPRIRDS